jgi:uncharacterized iron-regulated protein
MSRRPVLAVRIAVLGSALVLAAGCASRAAPGAQPRVDAEVVLVGELHDDDAHQRRQRELVQLLADRGRLAAVALEMAEQGASTAGLPRGADASAVRAALRWNEDAWPWAAYGPAVMAAVAAGVPVLGANLPRGEMRAAMADASLDATLDRAALDAQREAIRAGHCDLLPLHQLTPMVRVQVARDRAMARTAAAAALPGKTVLLIAGAGHVDPGFGVPRHLPAGMRAQSIVLPRSPGAPATDHCEALRRQLQPVR